MFETAVVTTEVFFFFFFSYDLLKEKWGSRRWVADSGRVNAKRIS